MEIPMESGPGVAPISMSLLTVSKVPEKSRYPWSGNAGWVRVGKDADAVRQGAGHACLHRKFGSRLDLFDPAVCNGQAMDGIYQIAPAVAATKWSPLIVT